MSIDVNETLDREQTRQCKADEMTVDHGSEWREQFAPGSFGCHELLDRVNRAAEQIERDLLNHPACIASADWYSLADEAASALHKLYQRIGAVHLDADHMPPRTNSP
ncbi:MAG TPA: hypothetical protein VFW87_03290 [Pirellulales bacterium]|nr:hypothetical protein [Pirellulales bacterium]